MEDAMKLVDVYLSEGRPQEHKVFISEVKTKYERLRNVQIKQVELPMVRAIDRIIVKAFIMLKNLEGIHNEWDYERFRGRWFGSQDFRKQLYRKHKAAMSGLLQKSMRDIKKGRGSSVNGMKEYIKQADALMKYFKDNKEIYDAIETKWYNIFGGPREAVRQNKEAAKYYSEDYQKAMKVPEMKVATVFSASGYIMGVKDDVADEIVEWFMSPRLFIYALVGS